MDEPRTRPDVGFPSPADPETTFSFPSGRALIYCHAYTLHDMINGAMQRQTNACRAKARELGYAIGNTLQDIGFDDQQQIRQDLNRPTLAYALTNLRDGSYNALIVFTPDRISLRPADVIAFTDECRRLSVLIIAVQPS